ncbi:HAD family hydrolase [Halostagnicola bangensis]
MTEYDAVVYDLDGTLVDLAVDWKAVAIDVLAVYSYDGVEPPSTELWDMLDASSSVGLASEIEETIADHEREGARRSERLAHADDLLEREVPVGVCSLNCEAACRIALEEHGLADAVGAVVGRDTMPMRKPDPEPLIETIRSLSVNPTTTLFVGDSERDELAAERAGIDFEYVDGRMPGY